MLVKFLHLTLALSLMSGAFLSRAAVGQQEGLPAIAREVYRPHTELPPAPTARVVTERLVTEPPIVGPTVVDDSPAVPRAVVAPRPVVAAPAVAAPAVAPVVAPVVAPGAVAGTGRVAVAPAAAVALPGIFARFTYGFYDDGNADDNWYYDYYEVPKSAVVVTRPVTDAQPGFRTNWTYAPVFERGLFSW